MHFYKTSKLMKLELRRFKEMLTVCVDKLSEESR